MTPTKVPKPIFPITHLISDLSVHLGPQSPPSTETTSDQSIRRLIIVGDVHGMRNSLQTLLEKVNFNKTQGDHLILVGDLVNKGPDSPGVIDLAIKLGASAVRGNHDNAVLDAAAETKPASDLPQSDSKTIPETSQTDRSEESDPAIGKRHGPATYKTASELSPSQLDWLASLPLILRVKLPKYLKSSLGEIDTLVVAHAGLVPGIPLEKQDPRALMHMRSLVRTADDGDGNGDGFSPAESTGDEGWVVEWDRWQEQQASKTLVVFGHDAKRRLQLGRYTIGLDSGCLYGNQLSALVVEATNGELEHRIVQVECADEPVAPTEQK